MKIKIYCIGKIKEQYLKLGIEEYKKRISAYSNIEIIEVGDEPVKDNPSKAEIEIVKKDYERELNIAMGLASWRNDNSIDFEELVKIADQNMYADKRDFYLKSGNDRRKA